MKKNFPRVLTIIVSAIGLFFSVALVSVLLLSDSNVVEILTDKPRYYRAEFYNDDVLMWGNTIKRGDPIGFDEKPAKDVDADGTVYQYIGWDLTGDNIPDILPNRIYSNFTAHACYIPINIDFSKIDMYQLLQLLMDLNIDLESFMNYFGLTPEDIMELLDVPVLNYVTDATGVVYFRTESFGDYNQSKNKWRDGGYYSTKNISSGSINPLQFTADKISNITAAKHFELEYLKSGKKYPVPCYENKNAQGLNSESHSLEKVVGGKYETDGVGFMPASSYTINTLKASKFSNEKIEEDERAYRDYVYKNYLNVDNKYKDFFITLSNENEFYFNGDYNVIDQITNYFADSYTFNLEMANIPKNEDPILYFMTESKEGIGRHFAAATTLWFRSLGLPARYTQGYVDYVEEGVEVQEISAIQSHSWVEVYVDEVGWMTVDTSLSAFSQEMLGFVFGQSSFEVDPFSGRQLERIEVPNKKETCFIDEEFDKSSYKVTAYYDNDTSAEVSPSYFSPLEIDTSYVSTKLITVVYCENGVSKTDAFILNVVKPKLESISLDTAKVKTQYVYGDAFSINGLRVIGHYENGVDKDISVFDFNTPDTHVLGKHTVTITVYDDDQVFTDSYEIEVIAKEDIILERIEIFNSPDKVYVGTKISELPFEEFETYVMAYYTDGTSKEIPISDCKITTLSNLSTVGLKYFDITYTEFGVTANTSFEVEYYNVSPMLNYVDTKVYNGEPYQFTPIILGIEDNFTYDVSITKILSSTYKINDFSDIVDVGTFWFKVKITIRDSHGVDITSKIDNFDETQVISIEVFARSITLTSASLDKTDDGTIWNPQYSDGNNIVSIGGDELVPGHYINYEKINYTALIDEEGVYENTFDVDSVEIFDTNGRNVTSNYVITPHYGTLSLYAPDSGFGF